METKMLSEADLAAINAKYALDLSYSDATHYRAAQVIWSISHAKGLAIARDLEAVPAGDTPAAIPAPEGIA